MQVLEFARQLGEARSFYGYEPDSTIASLLIKIMPSNNVKFVPLQGCNFPTNENIFTAIIKTIAKGLNTVYGFSVNISVSYF